MSTSSSASDDTDTRTPVRNIHEERLRMGLGSPRRGPGAPPRPARRSRSERTQAEIVDSAIHWLLSDNFRTVTTKYKKKGSNKYYFLGPHCIGKSYLIKMVSEHLTDLGHENVVVSESLEKIQTIVTSPEDPEDPFHTKAMTQMLSARKVDYPKNVIVLIDRANFDSIPYTLTLQNFSTTHFDKPARLMMKDVTDLLESLSEIPKIDGNLIYCHVETEKELRECYDLIGHRGRDWELDWGFPQYKMLWEYMSHYFRAISQMID